MYPGSAGTDTGRRSNNPGNHRRKKIGGKNRMESLLVYLGDGDTIKENAALFVGKRMLVPVRFAWS